MKTQHVPPEWAFEFHGHRCPFMPIGYRMGKLALAHLGLEPEPDHGFFIFPEIGEGHPQACMMDGLQASTGATYGKLLMAKTFYGKLAATFYHPQEGRRALCPQSGLHRCHGEVRILCLSEKGGRTVPDPGGGHGMKSFSGCMTSRMISSLKWKQKPDFKFKPVKGSFNKAKCSLCHEYVFERYVRIKDGQPVCIPCSGYEAKT